MNSPHRRVRPIRALLTGLLLLSALSSTAELAPEFQARPSKRASARSFSPKRTRPVFTGEFKVDLVAIAFPDCHIPEPAQVKAALNSIRGSTVTDYYKEYSQGTTWPVLQIYDYVYIAPQPFGYYCEYKTWANRIGWRGKGEGGRRAAQLRKEALAAARQNASLPERGRVTCYVYCQSLNRGTDGVLKHLRGAYPYSERDKQLAKPDPISQYRPAVAWGDPLWPNSLPQVSYPGSGGTIVHELGHVLGAPDFYHATEPYDGLPGTPCLPWDYGPTGPAYCRAIYQAFVPMKSYPTYTKPGSYTLHPRSTNPCTGKNLGCFIPSSHPNYLFYLEFVQNERPPIGHPGQEGLLIHVINVTMGSPMQGPPDLCYTYRPDDPYFKARGANVQASYFQTGDSFDEKSNPKAMIPPLIPAGIAIRNIKIGNGACTFDLEFPPVKLSGQELARCLLPKIALRSVDEVTSTSFRAHAEMLYRGEPHKTEYGFCYGKALHPTIRGPHFPLYHRDRYDARIIDLTPGGVYYVRAYAKSPSGVTYSRQEKKVNLRAPEKVKEIYPLLTDHILGNFYIKRHHFAYRRDYYENANTILALMSLANYYRSVPGDTSRGRDLDAKKIHTSPSDSRPGFRMAELNALYGKMRGMAKAAGLYQREFGDEKKWIRNCAKCLRIRDYKTSFFFVDKETIKEHEAEIKKWLQLGQPVLLVRENKMIREETQFYFPLDIAIIDGYDTYGAYHVVYPLGKDRSLGSPSGFYTLNRLFEYVEKSCLIFYRPGASSRRGSSLSLRF